MNKPAKIEHPLALLREEFPKHQISKLPKETRAQIDARKNREQGCMVFNCPVCGGHHHKDAVHLDYVGHAALTDRLLDTDMEWSWEPVGFTPEGLPALDRNGGLWIKLTVCGVTRYGYGAADGKSGGDAMKEMIGDALRNAAMRFGAALDLWHKGDLHVEEDDSSNLKTGETPPEKRVPLDGPYKSKTALQTAIRAFAESLRTYQDDLAGFNAWMETEEVVELEKQAMRDLPGWWDTGEGCATDFEPMTSRIHRKKQELEQLETIRNRQRTVIDAG